MTEFLVGLGSGVLAVVVIGLLKGILLSMSRRPMPRPIGRSVLEEEILLGKCTQVVTYGCPRCAQRWVSFFTLGGSELTPNVHMDMNLHDCREEA